MKLIRMEVKWTLFVLLACVLVFTSISCKKDSDEKVISSRSYSGHENDQDANNFVKNYPKTVGRYAAT